MTLLLAALSTTGCASIGQFAPGADTDAQTADTSAHDVLYDIKYGDSLTRIAKRITGELDNWQIIAAHNGISNPGSITAGDTLRIPTSLLQNTQRITNNFATVSLASSALTSRRTGVSFARLLPSLPDVNATIKVSAVDVNRSFSLLPIGSYEVSKAARKTANPVSTAPKITVTGTYFPKGVYKQPADYAPLLQRVAPGSVFELEYKIGDWFKVKTDQGDGYIRYSDVTLVP